MRTVSLPYEPSQLFQFVNITSLRVRANDVSLATFCETTTTTMATTIDGGEVTRVGRVSI